MNFFMFFLFLMFTQRREAGGGGGGGGGGAIQEGGKKTFFFPLMHNRETDINGEKKSDRRSERRAEPEDHKDQGSHIQESKRETHHDRRETRGKNIAKELQERRQGIKIDTPKGIQEKENPKSGEKGEPGMRNPNRKGEEKKRKG